MAGYRFFIKSLIRALIPSWRFFSEIGDTPQLLIQILDKNGEPQSDWFLHSSFVSGEPQRGLKQLFYNPSANLRLAHRSLVTRFLDAADSSGTATEAAPFLLMIEKTCRAEIPKSDVSFHFKIQVLKQEASVVEVFVSHPRRDHQS